MTGDNGLLQKAQTAKEENEEAKELELIKLAVSAAQVAGEGTITKDNLENELKSDFNDNTITVEEIKEGWSYKNYKIDKNGQINKILPKEYQQVEYIESIGKQYINTKIIPMYNDTFTLNYSPSALSGGFTPIIGAASDGNSGRVYISDFIASRYCGNRPFEKSNVGEKYKYEFTLLNDENSILKVNNIEVASMKLTVENLPMMLFARNNNENRASGKIYNFVWIRNNMVIYKFIPCYSTTTVTDVDGIERPKDTVGLYDIVNGQFYVNKGTGTFGYGMEDGTYVAPTNN